MKIVKIAVLASTIAFGVISCKEGKKNESATPMGNEMHQEDVTNEEVVNNGRQNAKVTTILDGYLSIKDALVADDSEKAAEIGSQLVTAFDDFDVSEYSEDDQGELQGIIESVKEQAEHIADSPMEKQREHFKTMSKDVTEMVEITGSDKKLYEQFCPMYDKGSAWLSASNAIRNPYYGSKMLACGKVQREIY